MTENSGKSGAWKKGGPSPNPGGRPKIAEAFRDRARKAVDETVLSAWIREVETLGDEWVRCSELLAAYGYGKPSSAPEDLEAVKRAAPLAGLSVEQILALAAVKTSD